MMMLSRIDLIHQYYVEEWSVERISMEADCTPQTVRNRRASFGLPDRDRDWTEEDDVAAESAIAELSMGASLIGDMRTIASELLHRTSTVLHHCSGGWLARYAPHVDTIPPGLGGFHVSRPTMRIKKLDPAAREPIRQTAEAAAFDLHSIEDVVIPTREQVLVGTGLSIAVPTGWAGLICPRSGMSAKSGITVQNSPGIIDSDYRGEVKVILYNTGITGEAYKVEVGDRIAQLMLVPCFLGSVTEVDNIEDTGRGTGGFGHTGT
jgi:dUTP pyrophosphatase